MILQDEPQLVPQSLLPHPGSQDKMSLKHLVDSLEYERIILVLSYE